MRLKLSILFKLLLVISLLQINAYADGKITILNDSDAGIIILIDKNAEIVNYENNVTADIANSEMILVAFFSSVKNLLDYILQNSLSLLLIAIIIGLIIMFKRYWIMPEDDIVIMPFEVINNEDKYNGKALSDLLFAELQRIKHINSSKYERIENEELSKFPESPGEEKEFAGEKSLSKLGVIGLGSASISIGELMIIIKKLFRDNNQSIINGSLDKCDSKLKLMACIKGNHPFTWEVQTQNDSAKQSDSIDDYDREMKDHNESIFISDLIRDLSYGIIFNLPQSNISAKTLLGFKHYTEALYGYQQYILTTQIKYLKIASKNCLTATKIERNYKKPLGLFFNLGIAYYNEKMYFDSVIMFNEAIRLDPNDSLAWINKSAALLNQGKNEEAVKACDEAIRLDQNNPLAWTNKGGALANLGKNEEAIKACDKAIRLDQNISMAWSNKGGALANQGKNEEAVEACDEAIRLDQNNSLAWTNKSAALGNLDKNEEAVEACDEAIQLDQNNSLAWTNKSAALGNLDKNEEAVKACNEAIRLDQNNSLAWSNKGYALSKLGQNTEAVKAFKEAIKIDPKFTFAWHHLGVSLRSLGQATEAEMALAKAKDLGYKG